MIVVAAGLGDDVEGSAFGAAVLRGEAVGGDLELLDGLEGELHDGAADGVVLVIDAVDGGVGVAAGGAVDGVDGVSVLGGVVGVDQLHAGGEDGEVREVTAVEGQVGNLLRGDVGGAVGLFGVNELISGGDFDGGVDAASDDGDVGGEGGSDEQLKVSGFGGGEARGLDGDGVGADGEQVEAVLAGAVGGGGALSSGFSGDRGDVGAGDGCAGRIGYGSHDVAGRRRLCEEMMGASEKH